MSAVKVGQLFGRLEAVTQITDGRWRCKCLRCRKDGTIVSAPALQRGGVTLCWDCQIQVKARRQSARPIASVKRSVARKDEHGWSLPEAA
jgi:hypothetical protein